MRIFFVNHVTNSRFLRRCRHYISEKGKTILLSQIYVDSQQLVSSITFWQFLTAIYFQY